MLRMNVAPNVYAKGSWIVHLYAEAGDEHIYQLRAVSATNAARIALEGYEADRRKEMKPVETFIVPLTGAAPEYPDWGSYGPWR